MVRFFLSSLWAFFRLLIAMTLFLVVLVLPGYGSCRIFCILRHVQLCLSISPDQGGFCFAGESNSFAFDPHIK